MSDILLTSSEVKKILKISTNTLQSLEQSKALNPIRISKRIKRYKKTEIEMLCMNPNPECQVSLIIDRLPMGASPIYDYGESILIYDASINRLRPISKDAMRRFLLPMNFVTDKVLLDFSDLILERNKKENIVSKCVLAIEQNRVEDPVKIGFFVC